MLLDWELAVVGYDYERGKGDHKHRYRSHQLDLGVDYAMSKRTSMYALYTKMDNSGDATAGGTYGIGVASGA